MTANTDWETRVAQCWNRIRSEDIAPEQIVATIDALAAERPVEDPSALYERASARDSAGLEFEAEPLYRAALSSGLDAKRRPQAVIQLGSTLRNIGKLDESEDLLRGELDRCTRSPDSNSLFDETRAFLALTLLAQGKAVEAAALALTALGPHLKRYSRSVTENAEELGNIGIAAWMQSGDERLRESDQMAS